MNYGEALKKFEITGTVCVLVKTKEGLQALSEHNLAGGVCNCCEGVHAHDNLKVEKVVDLKTMNVLYSA